MSDLVSCITQDVLIIAEKERRRKELGLPDPSEIETNTFNSNVLLRPMLRLPNTANTGDSTTVTIMTYNLLAQALIRRRMFPFSGTSIAYLSYDTRRRA